MNDFRIKRMGFGTNNKSYIILMIIFDKFLKYINKYIIIINNIYYAGKFVKKQI